MCGKMGRFLFRSLHFAMVIQVLTSTVPCNSKKSESTSDTSNSTSQCNDASSTDLVRQRGSWTDGVCSIITKGEVFDDCRKRLDDFQGHYNDCINDSCGQGLKEAGEDMCKVIEGFAAACASNDVCVDWRSNDRCPKMCPYPKVYVACRYSCYNTSDARLSQIYDKPMPMIGQCDRIADECRCPNGMITVNGTCVALKDVPCEYKGKTYRPGDRTDIGRQSCVCESGRFICIGEPCGTA